MMTEEMLLIKFFAAHERLVANDLELLQRDVSERALVAKLHQYLVEQFAPYATDVEYNRAGMKPKRVMRASECTVARTFGVVPDIVVHLRGSDDHNLVVCEVKKSISSKHARARDRQKLREIKRDHLYAHALLVVVPVGPSAARSPCLFELVS